MDYRKPWSFRLGVIAFAAFAFLAATGRSIGSDAAPKSPQTTVQQSAVLDAAVVRP